MFSVALTLAIAGYLALLAGVLWAVVRSVAAPTSLCARYRRSTWLLAGLAVLYMLWSPACLYLPVAPGAPAVRRFILGSDSQGRVYWLEAKEPLAFVMGPRWWFEFNVHAPPGRAGVEWIPPMRFSRTGERRIEVVRSDGFRKPVNCPGSLLATQWAWNVLPLRDGAFLLSAGGRYRLEAETGDCTPVAEDGFRPDAIESRNVAVEGRPVRLAGAKKSMSESMSGQATVAGKHGGEGQLVIASAVVLDPGSGEDLGLRSISIPFSGSRKDVESVDINLAADGYYLLVGLVTKTSGGVRTRTANLYWLDRDLENPRQLAQLSCRGRKLLVSHDGRLVCTRDAVYTREGRLVERIWPSLDSGAWVGHRLVAVFEGAFVGRGVLPVPTVPRYRFGSIEKQLDAAHPSKQRASENLPDGWSPLLPISGRPDRWIFGGWDEAGGTDHMLARDIEA